MPRKERVTRVIDGDTFETANRKHPVRLAGVDTPEKGKPGSRQAREALARMIEGETVNIDTKARDTYGRSVVNVKAGGRSVKQAMKKHGH